MDYDLLAGCLVIYGPFAAATIVHIYRTTRITLLEQMVLFVGLSFPVALAARLGREMGLGTSFLVVIPTMLIALAGASWGFYAATGLDLRDPRGRLGLVLLGWLMFPSLAALFLVPGLYIWGRLSAPLAATGWFGAIALILTAVHVEQCCQRRHDERFAARVNGS